MSPQIVLYALPTSPKNTFINFCGDLRQVLTMGKLMVHPRFWPKPPKCENNNILIFENLKNLNFVFCPSGPAARDSDFVYQVDLSTNWLLRFWSIQHLFGVYIWSIQDTLWSIQHPFWSIHRSTNCNLQNVGRPVKESHSNSTEKSGNSLIPKSRQHTSGTETIAS